MTSHGERRPLLPVVTEDTISDVSLGVGSSSRLEFEALQELRANNPALTEALCKLAQIYGQSEGDKIKHCATVAVLVCKMLQTQAEIDQMKSNPLKDELQAITDEQAGDAFVATIGRVLRSEKDAAAESIRMVEAYPVFESIATAIEGVSAHKQMSPDMVAGIKMGASLFGMVLAECAEPFAEKTAH